MTTSTLPPALAPTPPPGRHAARGGPLPGVTFVRVLRSEWLKLRSVRSSTTALAASAGALVLVGLIYSAIVGGVLSGNEVTAQEVVTDATAASLSGLSIAQLVIGVLGVLTITAEYATGLIRTTLTVVPRRLSVLAAKAVVVAVATFPTMLVASLIAFLGGQALIGSGELDPASLGDPGVLRAVVGTAGYLTAVALMGLAVGVLVRSSAAAISTLVGVVFLLPGLGSVLLPASWRDDVLQYLPSNAGTALTSVPEVAGLLGPAAAGLTLLAWVLVPLVVAAVALRRRSA